MSNKYPKILVEDWETSGLVDWMNAADYTKGPQGLQLGCCVVEDPYDSWEIVDEFTTTLKWLGPVQDRPDHEPEYPNLTWENTAEQIHRLSKHALLSRPHPKEIANSFHMFIRKHFPGKITMAGFNPLFDMYFQRQFQFFTGLTDLEFNHRYLDLHTLGFIALGAHNSNEVFSSVCGVRRGDHNALEDARLTAKSFQIITKSLKEQEGKAQEWDKIHPVLPLIETLLAE